MATQIPTQSSSIKPIARKLPIKRKPVLNSPDPPITTPNPNPNPNSPIPYDNFDDDESNSQDDDEEAGGDGGDLKPPPFKFHRIWSESDEIRFLQGLLGCASQGMLFPRDLNVFYDRFSESMPQPYTRSQLSEKLRRLRKKFRIMSGRIARGQDPNRLTPHDRDLLHLCSRLWDPKFASGSPFSDAGGPVAAVVGGSRNKRRRPNRRPKAEEASANVLLIGYERNEGERGVELDSEVKGDEELATAVVEEKPKPMTAANAVGDRVGKREDVGDVVAKTVLDVFDKSLKEVRESLSSEGSSSGSELVKRWQEQRVAELDVFARRLRLVLEQSLRR